MGGGVATLALAPRASRHDSEPFALWGKMLYSRHILFSISIEQVDSNAAWSGGD
jgi:hypothetical protein